MPTKMTETALYSPGKLVQTRHVIYSVEPSRRLPEGTVGVIISGPQKGYSEHCQVHFVAVHEPWWVNFTEIQPYFGE